MNKLHLLDLGAPNANLVDPNADLLDPNANFVDSNADDTRLGQPELHVIPVTARFMVHVLSADAKERKRESNIILTPVIIYCYTITIDQPPQSFYQ